MTGLTALRAAASAGGVVMGVGFIGFSVRFIRIAATIAATITIEIDDGHAVTCSTSKYRLLSTIKVIVQQN
ncbi:hypothetical protein M5E06_13590 [Azospirillum sp. A1-3]|uniref:hypothetical protein n=1 Tax=Azospirillum sp. A1-3 TaxID=185874 RepID=UPI0020779BF1|nr:hypothetical protein [Azospirillum sp. A1-3]MCM8735217.1 hypothetical protein [Azospirillum sp. A1-3]